MDEPLISFFPKSIYISNFLPRGPPYSHLYSFPVFFFSCKGILLVFMLFIPSFLMTIPVFFCLLLRSQSPLSISSLFPHPRCALQTGELANSTFSFLPFKNVTPPCLCLQLFSLFLELFHLLFLLFFLPSYAFFSTAITSQSLLFLNPDLSR